LRGAPPTSAFHGAGDYFGLAPLVANITGWLIAFASRLADHSEVAPIKRTETALSDAIFVISSF
jgi:hypothetical protein